MIIISDGISDHTPCLDGIISRAARLGYEVNVEFIDTTVPFLNVEVTVDPEKQQCSTKLFTKPTDTANTPLDARSAQPWHVHQVWPRSMLQVAQQIEGSSKTATAKMINKFHSACLPPPEVAKQIVSGARSTVLRLRANHPAGSLGHQLFGCRFHTIRLLQKLSQPRWMKRQKTMK